MKELNVVGWDNGYDYEKIVVGNDKIKFPSVIYKPSSNKAIFNVTSDTPDYYLDKLILKYNNDEYFIGEYAIEQDPLGGVRNFKDDKFNDNSETVKLLAGLSALYPNVNEISIENLMLGLSLTTYKKYKDIVLSRFKNKDFKYQLPNKQNVMVSIKKVICIPQGVGAFYDKLLNNAGYPSDDTLIDTRYGLVDVGGKTVDAFISHGIEPIRGTDIGLSYGASDAYKQVSKRLNDLPYNLIEKAYVNGKNEVYWKGNYYKIRDLCNKMFERLAEDISSKVQVEWTRHFDRLELILLCGGGAQVVVNYLENLYSIKIDVVDGPQYANARGYYKLGKYALRRGN